MPNFISFCLVHFLLKLCVYYTPFIPKYLSFLLLTYIFHNTCHFRKPRDYDLFDFIFTISHKYGENITIVPKKEKF